MTVKEAAKEGDELSREPKDRRARSVRVVAHDGGLSWPVAGGAKWALTREKVRTSW